MLREYIIESGGDIRSYHCAHVQHAICQGLHAAIPTREEVQVYSHSVVDMQRTEVRLQPQPAL
jgi:hypothetical protein